MKPIIKIGTWWFFSKGVVAMSLFPYIFLDKTYMDRLEEDKFDSTINHESIHIHQQLEMLVLFFYLWYGIEYLLKLITYGKGAYMTLSFEREAYMNERDLEYL